MCCCRKKKTLDVKYTGRHCTDVVCLALFGAAWFITIVILISASRTADTAALSFARDYTGAVCGSEKTMPGSRALGCDKKSCQQVYYPKLGEDVSVSLLSNTTISLFGICLPECPKARDVVCTYNYTDTVGVPSYDQVIQCSNSFYRSIHSKICNNCWIVPLNTTNVMNRCIPLVDTVSQSSKRCVVPDSPADPTAPNYVDPESPACLAQTVEETVTHTKASQTDVLTNSLLSIQVFLQRYMSDISASSFVLVIGGVTSFVLGFVFLFFIKTFSQCMVWTCIVLGLLLCVIVTIFLYYQADIIPLDDWFNFVVEKGDETFHWGNITFNSFIEEIPEFMMASDATRDYWAIAAYIMTALTLILFFVVIALSNSVKISSAVMKEASNAINKIPSLLSIPILVTCLNVGLFVVVLYSYSMTLSSNLTISDYADKVVGTVGVQLPTNATNMFCEDYDTMTNCTFISKTATGSTGTDLVLTFWHLFIWFWSSGFINAIGTMTVAGTVGKWYFHKGDSKDIGVSTVIKTFVCVVCYHLGSVAYGSFVIALIQLFRSIMLYLDQKFKDNQSQNPLLKCGFKCCHCCLACLEKCMKYLSRNAYILVITRGTNFFKSSVTSFSLLAANIGTVSMLKSVSTLFIWMGKLTNIIISVAVVVLMIYNAPSFLNHPIITPVGPALVAFILSYVIASIFIQIYVITIDTIMLCYCEDTREHGKNSEALEGKIGANGEKLDNKQVEGEEGEGEGEEGEEEEGEEETTVAPAQVAAVAPQVAAVAPRVAPVAPRVVAAQAPVMVRPQVYQVGNQLVQMVPGQYAQGGQMYQVVQNGQVYQVVQGGRVM